MSIVNFVLTADRVVLVTDTLTYRGNEPAGLTDRKAGHNGRYAFAARGPLYLCDTLLNVLGRRGSFAFDEDVETIADLTFEDVSEDNPLQLFVFGFSATQRRMRAVQYRWPGHSALVREYEDGVFLNPGVPTRSPLPLVATDDQLLKVSIAQHVSTKRNNLNYCVGGVAHLTEVTVAGPSRRIFGLFPDYDEMSSRFIDPNAAAVAAWRNSRVAATA